MKTKKNRKAAYILSAIVIVLLCMSFSTSIMLRVAVFFYSPKSAFNMDYAYYKDEGKNGKVYKITKNPPVEESTDGILTTWIVYNIGPIKYATYHGEE